MNVYILFSTKIPQKHPQPKDELQRLPKRVLSASVLRSRRAVQVNVEMMRAFVYFREVLVTHKDLVRKLEDLEKKYDKQFAVVFQAIEELMRPPEPKKHEIGFKVKDEQKPVQTRS
jgi:hypothetical protein